MRLTKLKLAGFKSFVDPTTVLLPGQLVGVVGPNGCGKSNIMDAVRWVLGESRATELRGESMQDVIFNGSGNRKPVGRASVELVFDNNMGRLAGQWSVYPEIAVKRVLDREGNSSYHINNLQVRRKDVIDLFLGTGLGPRAYAIIGQGMISRIIEARPEDLRLFLEEAAGVSKYKERRKETQHRLEDARENLLRVDDIRVELESRIQRLEGQAEVARSYRALQEDLVRSQSLLWYVRRRNARIERTKLAQEVERASNLLEERTSQLRSSESELEILRQAQFAASDALHAAQAELYAANAEVFRLETELGHRKENRRRIESRLSQLATEESNWRQQGQTREAEEADWKRRAEDAELRLEQAEARHEAFAGKLPELENTQQAAEQAVQALRRDLAQLEQQLRVEETRSQAARKSLDGLAQRRLRIQQEQKSLAPPDRSWLDQLQAAQADLEAGLVSTQNQLKAMQAEQPGLQTTVKSAQETERLAQRQLTESRARRDALRALQAKVQPEGRIGEWLRQHGLAEARPLWQSLRVEAGWELAVEAVLRERFSALLIDPGQGVELVAKPLAASMAFGFRGSLDPSTSIPSDSLLHKLRCDEPAWLPVLARWLGAVRCTEDLNDLPSRRGELAAGECWITKEAQTLDAHGLGFFAPTSQTHGVLERQEEISRLDGLIESQEGAMGRAREAVSRCESALNAAQTRLAELRKEAEQLQRQGHAGQLEIMGLTQALQRFEESQSRVKRELDDLEESEAVERESLEQCEMAAEGLREQLDVRREGLDARLESARQAEQRVRDARHAEQGAARELQDARFAIRECESRLTEITRHRALVVEQLERCRKELETGREDMAGLEGDDLECRLQGALEARTNREQSLAVCRNGVEESAAQLRQKDQDRLRIEQELTPLRDRIGDLKLKEQAALLNEEQYQQRLLEGGIAEQQIEDWAARPGAELREARLNAEINRLNAAIGELGAVNLAALEELATARERKGFLDTQFEDLSQAIGTLEDAIRRIDRETRDQLQGTYDQVNAGFGRLFPELFGGGEAKLILTGDEILDAGIQVMAQPPGKKNSTIHLLSGGEKALTAIALVFSIFQLNPAPFCLLDEVDAPLDDTNTERFCEMVKRMSQQTQFLYISHNKITMEMAHQLVGVTMQESGVSRVVEVDIEEALKLRDDAAA